MSFSVAKPQTAAETISETYKLNASISVAANLREAFANTPLLQDDYQEARVMVASPVLLVPIGEADIHDMATLDTLYRHSFTSATAIDTIAATVVEDLGVIAVFTVDRDVRTVLTDHFNLTTFIPTALPVWREAYRRAFSPTRHKLHAYFHDGWMEVFCFHQNRFAFHNTLPATHAHDALYYLLFTWRQLALDAEHDELELTGDMPHDEWLTEHLRQHLRIVHSS